MNSLKESGKIVRIFFIIAMFAFTGCGKISRPGLLIVAHGSERGGWNGKIMSLNEAVLRELRKKNLSAVPVEVCFLESGTDIAAGIDRLIQAGADRILALPLFFTYSTHLCEDVPRELGLRYAPGLKQKSVHKGAAHPPYKGKYITLGPPLGQSPVLKKIILGHARMLSHNPSTERLVILCHGSDMFGPHWDAMANDIGNYVKEKMSLTSWDYAYVGAGQHFIKNGLPVIRKKFRGTRTLVVGMFMGTSALDVAEASLVKAGYGLYTREAILFSDNVRYCDMSLLPDEDIVRWIADITREFYDEHR